MTEDGDGIILLDDLPPPQRPATPVVVARTGATGPVERALAAEIPVSISFNGVAHAVMMASPLDLEDFVAGFALSEEIVSDTDEIEDIDLRPTDLGVLAQVLIPAARQAALIERRRTLVGQTSCGLCGIVELEQAVRHYASITAAPGFTATSVFAALDALRSHQLLNRATGAAHAAALVDIEGRVVAVREDVGRHTALDKLIGHIARAGLQVGDGFVLMTSRISFELVQKCLARGIPALVGLSAPTTLAVDLAARHRLTLLALARPDAFQVHGDPFGLFPSTPP